MGYYLNKDTLYVDLSVDNHFRHPWKTIKKTHREVDFWNFRRLGASFVFRKHWAGSDWGLKIFLWRWVVELGNVGLFE